MGAASSDTKGRSSLTNILVPPWKGQLAGDHLVVSGLSRLWDTGRTLREKFRTPQPSNPQGEKSKEWPSPHYISLFLPEFPLWPVAEQQELKILGCVAKGSLGPVLKVLDRTQQKVFALKVLPKVEVLRRNTLKQCKEEVSIQRQVKHPFIQCLGESWQGQQHLFIMCSYCSFGDLYSLWTSCKRIDEDTVRIFAAELVTVLAYLHDLGIVHRDVKMENVLLDERGHLKLSDFGLARHLPYGERAHTICGTLQYMAPEVLSGGPYSHSADWWSLGVLLFALSTGEFPAAPEKDHMSMLESVNQATFEVPQSLSQALSHLLKEHPWDPQLCNGKSTIEIYRFDKYEYEQEPHSLLDEDGSINLPTRNFCAASQGSDCVTSTSSRAIAFSEEFLLTPHYYRSFRLTLS